MFICLTSDNTLRRERWPQEISQLPLCQGLPAISSELKKTVRWDRHTYTDNKQACSVDHKTLTNADDAPHKSQSGQPNLRVKPLQARRYELIENLRRNCHLHYLRKTKQSEYSKIKIEVNLHWRELQKRRKQRSRVLERCCNQGQMYGGPTNQNKK